ncbi:hypothetical protein VTJ04DRAFT_1212 [Mycothermus thermophilus]|uniref:uncharacterized protein n=1 Tax=Humicola insolens TaxID=85995 RepID=UPI003742F020
MLTSLSLSGTIHTHTARAVIRTKTPRSVSILTSQTKVTVDLPASGQRVLHHYCFSCLPLNQAPLGRRVGSQHSSIHHQLRRLRSSPPPLVRQLRGVTRILPLLTIFYVLAGLSSSVHLHLLYYICYLLLDCTSVNQYRIVHRLFYALFGAGTSVTPTVTSPYRHAAPHWVHPSPNSLD